MFLMCPHHLSEVDVTDDVPVHNNKRLISVQESPCQPYWASCSQRFCFNRKLNPRAQPPLSNLQPKSFRKMVHCKNHVADPALPQPCDHQVDERDPDNRKQKLGLGAAKRSQPCRETSSEYETFHDSSIQGLGRCANPTHGRKRNRKSLVVEHGRRWYPHPTTPL